MTEYLILVDENDREIGKQEKMKVHELGLLHRAFSVFILNTNGELLLQQRAHRKYHSPDLWTNTCCSHPHFGETTADAVKRRLQEEMGMNCLTKYAFSFTYKAEFENGLTEHEFDHVYLGVTDAQPIPEQMEVQDWKYMGLPGLEADIRKNPGNYTEWLKTCFPQLINHLGREKIFS